MAALDGVEKDFCRFLNAFEKRIVFRGAGCGALVGVVPEDFLAVGGLDLRLGRAEAVARKAEDSVVILSLFNVSDPSVKALQQQRRGRETYGWSSVKLERRQN